MPKSVVHRPGAVCHIEIPAPDLGKARNFYVSVFGWEIEKGGLEESRFFRAGDMGGDFDPALEPNERGLGFVIAVDDVASTLKDVVARGGRVKEMPREIPGDRGLYARVADPNGNGLAIWSPRK